MEVTVIVPQYNQPELTIGCLRSLTSVHRTEPHLIVVDDGSEGDAAARVRCECPEARVVSQPHMGVTAAWNHGKRLATTELVVFLNNDAESQGAWIEHLTAPLQNPDVRMTGTAARVEPALSALHLDFPAPPRLLEGWCFALRRRELEVLNGFDESLRLYFSDTDLQVRMWQRGRGVSSALSVVRGLPLRHTGHRTARTVPQRRSIWRRDRQRFIEKWSAAENPADR